MANRKHNVFLVVYVTRFNSVQSLEDLVCCRDGVN
jgi:hypothetical protein